MLRYTAWKANHSIMLPAASEVVTQSN